MVSSLRIYLALFLLLSVSGGCDAISNDRKKIILFGAGYVGTVSGACMASIGHKITFIEPSQSKVKLINNQQSPISEPQVENLISRGVEKGLIEAKCFLGEEILDADMAMIAVATPTNSEGVHQLEDLESVLSVLAQAATRRTTPLIVVIRSTLLPVSFRQLEKKYQSANANLILVSNPEFLRESTAVHDFFHPPFCVVGGDDLESVMTVLSVYDEICPKLYPVTVETACLLKYACNAFHAAKISFTNEIATICDSIKVSPVELMQIFSEDTLLNCSSAYLKPGFAFGGPCLAKDLKALVRFGNDLGEPLPLLSSIIPSNEARFENVLDSILQANHCTLAVLGMTFKKNSDDLRESPFVALIERLIQQGVTVRIFDPDLDLERTCKLGPLLPLIKNDLDSTLEGCDAVVLCKDLLSSRALQQLKLKLPIYNLGYFDQNQELRNK